MAPAAWVSSRIAICNRTGNFPIPGEARHYLAAAAGGFGFAPKSVWNCLSIGRMSLLKSIIENLEKEEGRTASMGEGFVSLRRLVVSSSRRLVVTSSRFRLVVSLSSRRLDFVSPEEGALVLRGPFCFCVLFFAGVDLNPQSCASCAFSDGFVRGAALNCRCPKTHRR